MSTKKLVQSVIQKKGGSNSAMVSALENANKVAIQQDRKNQNEKKGR